MSAVRPEAAVTSTKRPPPRLRYNTSRDRPARPPPGGAERHGRESTKSRSGRPSLSKSKKATPPPIDSGSSFCPSAPFSCSKVMPACRVMSTNAAVGGVTDDVPLRTGSGASGFAGSDPRRIQTIVPASATMVARARMRPIDRLTRISAAGRSRSIARRDWRRRLPAGVSQSRDRARCRPVCSARAAPRGRQRVARRRVDRR